MSLAIKIVLGIILFIILVAGVVSIVAEILAFVYIKTGGNIKVNIELIDDDEENAE